MKLRKRIKNLQAGNFVHCSFCKEKNADMQWVGYPYYGRTVCDDCYQKLVENVNSEDENISAGEEQAYRLYQVF